MLFGGMVRFSHSHHGTAFAPGVSATSERNDIFDSKLHKNPMTVTHRVRSFTTEAAISLAHTLKPLQRGTGDPTTQLRKDGFWTALCPNSPTVLWIQPPASTTQPTTVTAHAFGSAPEALEQVLAGVPQLLGVDESALQGWAEFAQALQADAWRGLLPSAVIRAHHEHPGLRLPATSDLVGELFRVVLEQKVTHDQARASWRWLVRSYGTPAPQVPLTGAPRLMVPPSASRVWQIPSWSWHRGGVQPPLARTMTVVASRADTLATLGQTVSIDELASRLTALPGIGPWTVAETLQRTHGAADLVSVGDYHLAHHVGEALIGRRVDDHQMLELLAPFAGHRHRVVRLIHLSGLRFSRFGPKLAPMDFRGF